MVYDFVYLIDVFEGLKFYSNYIFIKVVVEVGDFEDKDFLFYFCYIVNIGLGYKID